MYVLGISGGRRMGNSEILVKEALMGVEETGAMVEIVRLVDLDIKPPAGEDMLQVKGDDASGLSKKMSDCDGIILSAPTFCLTVPGFMMNIRDRVSIRHSIPEKYRIGALIAVGGTDWVNLVLPMLYLFLPHGHVKLVDQMIVPFTSHLGQVVLNDKALERARKIGTNVGSAMKESDSIVEYHGDEYWACPMCHQNLLKVRGKYVECPICDIKGSIEVIGDEIRVNFTEEDLQQYRWGHESLSRHQKAMRMSDDIYRKHKTEIQEKMKKYEAYHPTM